MLLQRYYFAVTAPMAIAAITAIICNAPTLTLLLQCLAGEIKQQSLSTRIYFTLLTCRRNSQSFLNNCPEL